MALIAALIPASDYHIGDMKWYVGSFATSGETVVKQGWLACNGALVSRTTYAKLYAEIGFAYSPTPGADPGSNQFYLPDYTDARVFIPRGSTSFTVRGTKGGARTIVLASDASQDPNHTHTYNNQFATSPSNATGPLTGAEVGPGGLGGSYNPSSGGVTGRPGGGPTAHQNMPPIRVVGGKIIRFA